MIHGILELAPNGGGHLRRRETGYQADPRDVAIPAALVRQLGLRPGDEITAEIGVPVAAAPGEAAEPAPNDRGPAREGRGRRRRRGRGGRDRDRGPERNDGRPAASLRITLVNGQPAEALRERASWDRLTAIHPNQRLRLDCSLIRRGQPDYTNRVIDFICPLGKGQRALIVAPAKAGKTMVLQAIAQGIATNHPEVVLFILLVDERPEEVFEMEAAGFGEVIASSFDHPPARHVGLAELTLERARRMVEAGRDVVLIVDSLTRLARAANAVVKGSGRTLSGGMGAESLEGPKRFFGSARLVDPRVGTGSLTIIATALIDTGSRMDQLIFEEFKGTGNAELVLNRELADRRIFPAIDVIASGTRREELLLPPEELAASQRFRRRIDRLTPIAAAETLLGLMRRVKTNAEIAG